MNPETVHFMWINYLTDHKYLIADPNGAAITILTSTTLPTMFYYQKQQFIALPAALTWNEAQEDRVLLVQDVDSWGVNK